jgi:3-hydroxyisobutyrate dehydrogenase-like beta-hydroxyacid dehydrogenase
MTAPDTKLGYIGLGKMGAPMAKRLVGWPGGLVVFDVRAEAMTPLAEAGAAVADSVADVAAADIISITVLNDEQVRDVVAELARNAKPGTVIAIHSTISDTTAAELAMELQPRGIHIVDAPVSGGGRAANKGELATMVGASEEAFALIKEPFSLWASLIIRAGDPGAGTRMKLARNMLHYISFAAACEASKLAERCGLNLQDLGKVVRHTDAITGGAGSIMFRDDMKPIEPDSFLDEPFLHARVLGEKDLSLALALGDTYSVELPLAAIAFERLAEGLGVPHTASSPSSLPSALRASGSSLPSALRASGSSLTTKE